MPNRVGELLTAEPGTCAVYRSGGRVGCPAAVGAPREGVATASSAGAGTQPAVAGIQAQVTLSAGGAHYPEDGLFLFERADECLYQSKRPGRDRWHRSPSPDTGGEPVSPGVTISV